MTSLMLAVLQVATLTLVGILGIATVLTRNPLRQAIVNSLFGLSLVLAFATLMAPDVAISEIVVASIAVPMVLLPVIYKTRGGGRG